MKASREGRNRQPARWLALFAVLLAFALRVYRLGDQNIWWDEGYSVYVARHTLSTLTTVAAADTHPPLYYWILHGWMGLGGQSEFALRFPALVFGVLTVAWVYRLGRHFGHRPAAGMAALAAFLLAINRFHVWWSQEIRMYSLAAMWAAASMVALLDFIAQNFRLGHRNRGQPSPRSKEGHWVLGIGYWPLYALAVAAGLYSLYLFVFVVAAEAVCVGWSAWRAASGERADTQAAGKARRFFQTPGLALLAGWGGAVAAAALAVLPWLAYTLPRLKSWSAASEFGPLTYLQLTWTALTLGLTEQVERYWAANLILAGILVAGGVVGCHGARRTAQETSPGKRQGGTPGVQLAVCVLIVPILGVFLLLTLPQDLCFAYHPPLEARYQLLSVPALALLLAASITALWKWRRAAGALAGIAVVALMVWVLPGYYQGRHLRDDLQTMTRALEAYAGPDDGLLLVSGDRFPLFNFRYDVLAHRDELPAVTTLPVRRVTPAGVEQWLAPLAQAHRRVWLAEVEKNLQDPDGLLADWLDENRHVVWREAYGYNRLTLYSLAAAPPVVASRLGESKPLADLGPAQVSGYDLPVYEVWPGDVARLVTYLRLVEPFTLTVSLADPGGQVLESRDEWLVPLPGELTRLRFDVPVYTRTPPGEYYFTLSSPWQRWTLAAPLRIAGTPPLERAGGVPNPHEAWVGQAVQLLGYRAPAAVEPGGALAVTLYWRASDKIEQRYTVFVQLVGTQFNPQTNGPLWAGHDSEPLDGGYPTTQWFVASPIVDTHVLAVPPDAPPGEYEVWVGMYTQPDIKRLTVYDGLGSPVGDHVVLGQVRVEGSQ